MTELSVYRQVVPALDGVTLYKIVGANGESIHGGGGAWSLPLGEQPGEWMPRISGKLAVCQSGYHLTPKPLSFWVPGARVFEAEYRGDVDATQLESSDSPKVAARESRLIREADWGDFCVWFDGEHEVTEGAVVAYGSATVTAYGSATVRAYDSATVTAYDSATVRAYGSATVRAYDSATVTAYGSATVRAYDSATVRAYGSATVTAYGSATVRAYGSATVRAYDSATVRAYDSATVTAYDSATVISSTYHAASAVVALEHMAVHVDRRSGKVDLRKAAP